MSSSLSEENHTGIGVYTRNLINAHERNGHKITKIGHDISYEMFNSTNQTDVINIKPTYHHLEKIYGSYFAMKKSRSDLIHFPVHRVDEFAAMMIPSKTKKVLTIHDITPLLPQFKEDAKAGRGWAKTFKYATKAADHIITDSTCTLNDCHAVLGIPKEKMTVVPLAANNNITRNDDKDGARRMVSEFLKTITKPFIMACGTNIPRKNLLQLIEAFGVFKRLTDTQYQLIIIGQTTNHTDDLVKRVMTLGLKNDVIIKKYMTSLGLNYMYNAAELFVYPSLYEGFGLPILEAMTCGTPIVAANTSSIPEVLGDAGILVDPTDAKKIAEGMHDMLSDESRKEAYVAKGLERVKKFTWPTTAAETWRVYEKITGMT